MPSVNPIGQFVMVLSLVLLSFIILGDPVEKFSLDYADWRHENETNKGQYFYRVHVQSLIPTRVHLSHFSRIFQKSQTSAGLCHLIHTASARDGDNNHPCDEDKHADFDQEHWFKTKTYKYITDQVFKNADTDEISASSLNTNISPLHKAMLLSGCYGNYHDIRNPISALNALEAEWFRGLVHQKNSSFVMNIMLQHLENTESLTSTRAPAPASYTSECFGIQGISRP